MIIFECLTKSYIQYFVDKKNYASDKVKASNLIISRFWVSMIHAIRIFRKKPLFLKNLPFFLILGPSKVDIYISSGNLGGFFGRSIIGLLSEVENNSWCMGE